MSRRGSVIALTAIVALLASLPAVASITRIGTYLEVGNGGIGELHPDVAYSNKSNAYLVVWGDGGGGTNRPTYAQLISGAGAPIGVKLKLTSCGGELYGQRPRVAYSAGSSDDVFVVMYKEWCSGAVRIWAHIIRYSAGGAVSGPRTVVRGAGAPGGIAYNAQRKEFIGVWEEVGSGTGYDAMGRTLPLTRDGSGAVTGFATLPTPIAIGQFAKTQGRPRIALDPGSQSYLIAFQGENPTTGAIALMYRTLDAATGALSPLMYASQGTYAVESSVVFLPDVDQFLVTWRLGTDVVGRRFAPVTGAPTSTTYPLIARPGTDGATGAAFDTTGGVGMVAGMNSDYSVWASEFSGSGAWVTTFRGSTAPPTPPGGGTFFPQVTATGSGGLALTYGIDYKKVFFERFSATASGEPPPPPPPPPSCTYSLSGSAASVSTTGGTGSLTVTTNTSPCSWTVSSNAAWLTANPGSGSATGSVSWAAQPNGTGAPRSAALSIAGHVFTVSQGGPASLALQFDQESYGAVLAYTPSTGNWATLLGQGSGLVAGPSGTWNPGWRIQAARFNGDDLADFFYYNETTGAWRKGINNGGSLTYYPGDFGGGWDTTVIDLNGDGLSDVFLYYPATGAWHKCISTSEQGFTCSAGSPSWAPGWKIYPAKFNNDGYGDLFLYNSTGQWGGLWFKLLGQGGNDFTYVAGDVRWAPDWQVTPGDFDGDGFTDLVLYRPADGLVFRVKFTASSASYVSSQWATTWTMRKGDFNGDRKTDLLLYDPSSADGRWAVGLSNTSGWFDFHYPAVGAGLGWTPYVGQLSGDAKADAVWYHASTGATVVWYATTPGSFNFVVGPTIQTGANLLLSPPTIP